MTHTSLHRRKNKLANTQNQLEILSGSLFQSGDLPTFSSKIKETNTQLTPKAVDVLQVNLGYMCNQVCAHCHVDAGPDRKEIMTQSTMQDCLAVINQEQIKTLDLTGGAPEMNPNFRWFVTEAHKLGVQDIIVRSNLTILLANPSYYDLPKFFKSLQIHVVSSLPHWTEGKTDKQRGKGVFSQSIKALQALNDVGYGMPDSSLKLDLVFNPSGAFLPGNQKSLQKEFKRKLLSKFNIQFHELFTITNLPISRFLEYLLASGNYETYMQKLVEAYNPTTLDHVMCRNTLSVGYDGSLYDCDFNQMLALPIQASQNHIRDYSTSILQREIAIHQHCYGCTAGSGSSCQGSLM